MEGTSRIGKIYILTIEYIPDPLPDESVGIMLQSVIVHPVLDLPIDSVQAQVPDPNHRPDLVGNIFHVANGLTHSVLSAGGRMGVKRVEENDLGVEIPLRSYLDDLFAEN